MLTVLASTTSIPSLTIAIVALALALAAYAGSLVYRSRRGQAVTDMQDKVINAYKADLDLRDAKIHALEEQNARQQAQLDAQREQIEILRQIPLIKVDALHDDVTTRLDTLAGKIDKANGKLDRLAAAR